MYKLRVQPLTLMRAFVSDILLSIVENIEMALNF